MFKVGDKVRIKQYKNEPEIVGMKCKVTGFACDFIVTDFRIEGFKHGYYFFADELELVA